MKHFTFLFLFFCFTFPVYSQIINTIAGTGGFDCSGDGGPAIDATFAGTISIAVDNSGNVYIDDIGCNRIRKINPSGIITLFAGGDTAGYSGDGGQAILAGLHQPTGVAVDRNGNVYIADNLNYRIRKVDASGIITTIAGTGINGYNGDNIPATAAELNEPYDVAVDSLNNIYIGDIGDGRVRKVNTAGMITTVAGNGDPLSGPDGHLATAVGLSPVVGVAVDGVGNLYISCSNNDPLFGGIANCIRKVNTSGIITTIAGADSSGYSGDGGAATSALLYYPCKIAVDRADNLFIADQGNNCIRKVDASGIISTFAGDGLGGYSGDGGPAINCELYVPAGLALDAFGNLYIGDEGNERVRYIRSTVFVNTVNNTPSNLSIYPNPCKGMFLLNITAHINEQTPVIIRNITGEKIKDFITQTNKPENIQIDVPPGIYIVTATINDEVFHNKVVVR